MSKCFAVSGNLLMALGPCGEDGEGWGRWDDVIITYDIVTVVTELTLQLGLIAFISLSQSDEARCAGTNERDQE